MKSEQAIAAEALVKTIIFMVCLVIVLLVGGWAMDKLMKAVGENLVAGVILGCAGIAIVHGFLTGFGTNEDDDNELQEEP